MPHQSTLVPCAWGKRGEASHADRGGVSLACGFEYATRDLRLRFFFRRQGPSRACFGTLWYSFGSCPYKKSGFSLPVVGLETTPKVLPCVPIVCKNSINLDLRESMGG